MTNQVLEIPEMQDIVRRCQATLQPDKLICSCGSHNGFYRYSEKKPFCNDCWETFQADKWKQIKKEHPDRFMPYCNVYGKHIEYSFDFYKKDFKHLDELKQYANKEKLYNILMYGEPGHGKTGLGISIIRELVKRGCDCREIYYTTENDFKNKIISLQNEKVDKESFLNKVNNCGLVVYDELGNYKTSDFMATTTKELIDEREKLNKPTILITNLNIKQIGNFYGSPFVSRLQTFKWMEIKNIDYRSKEIGK